MQHEVQRRKLSTPLHRRFTMKPRQTLLVSALVLLLSACSHPGGPGWGSGHGYGMREGGGPMMMGAGPGSGSGYGMGMGMGMMGSQGAMGWGLERLDLSADQRTRIAAIHDELHQRHWAQMQAMHAGSGPMAAWADEATQRQRFEQMSALHKQMFDAQLDARRRILEVLTPAQRQQLISSSGKPGS
jgi:Spy/CpxP family protein refolding chaperone